MSIVLESTQVDGVGFFFPWFEYGLCRCIFKHAHLRNWVIGAKFLERCLLAIQREFGCFDSWFVGVSDLGAWVEHHLPWYLYWQKSSIVSCGSIWQDWVFSAILQCLFVRPGIHFLMILLHIHIFCVSSIRYYWNRSVQLDDSFCINNPTLSFWFTDGIF